MRQILVSGHFIGLGMVIVVCSWPFITGRKTACQEQGFDLNCMLPVATLFARVSQSDQNNTSHHMSKNLDIALVQRNMHKSTQTS